MDLVLRSLVVVAEGGSLVNPRLASRDRGIPCWPESAPRHEGRLPLCESAPQTGREPRFPRGISQRIFVGAAWGRQCRGGGDHRRD